MHNEELNRLGRGNILARLDESELLLNVIFMHSEVGSPVYTDVKNYLLKHDLIKGVDDKLVIKKDS